MCTDCQVSGRAVPRRSPRWLKALHDSPARTLLKLPDAAATTAWMSFVYSYSSNSLLMAGLSKRVEPCRSNLTVFIKKFENGIELPDCANCPSKNHFKIDTAFTCHKTYLQKNHTKCCQLIFRTHFQSKSTHADWIRILNQTLLHDCISWTICKIFRMQLC